MSKKSEGAPMFKLGTLVRVRDEAVSKKHSAHYGSNRGYVEMHGYLHVVIHAGNSEYPSGLRFKSVSTGHEHRFFFDDELEVSDAQGG